MKASSFKSNDLSTSNPLEKQSVRTTISLDDDSLEALNWLIDKLNEKPKDIFDLITSTDFILQHKEYRDYVTEARDQTPQNEESEYRRKSLVISKGAQRQLNKLSKNHKIARDLIVRRLLMLCKAVVTHSMENEKKKVEKAYKLISDLMEQASTTSKEISKILDFDHPISERYGAILITLENLDHAIQRKLEDDIPIDPDFLSQD